MIYAMDKTALNLWELYAQQKSKGLIPAMVQTLAKLEKMDPKDSHCLNAKGEVAFLEKKFESAARFFKQAFAQKSKPEYQLNLGNALFNAEDFSGAKSVLIKYVQQNPEDINALINLANSFIRLEDLSAAEAICKKRISFSMGKSAFLNCLGQIAMLRKNPESALDFFSKAYEASPDFIEALFNRANALYALGRCEEAVAAYALCVRKDENYVLALHNMAILYLELERFDEAKQSLQKALKLVSHSADTFYTLGRVYLAEKEFRLARDIFRSAIKMDANHVPTLLALAKLCQIEMETEEAFRLVERILMRAQLSEEERRAAWALAYDLGQYQLCLNVLKKTPEADKFPHLTLRITNCLWKTGQKIAAIEQIEKYLQKVGETPEALTLLALMLEENGALDLAESRLQRALVLNPGADAPAFELARLYRSQNQMEKAIQILENVLTQNPIDADCLYNLACCHAQTKNLEDGLYYLKKAVQNGFHDLEKITQDEDLATVRKLKEYGLVLELVDSLEV